MFRLFDRSQKDAVPETNQYRELLINMTQVKFPVINNTYLKHMHNDIVMPMLKELDLNDSEFDSKYNCIMSGTIIFYISCEPSKYEGIKFSNSPHDNMAYLNLICDSLRLSMDYKKFIFEVGKKALEEKKIPFDGETINQYFGGFQESIENPLKPVLLERLTGIQNDHKVEIIALDEFKESIQSLDSDESGYFGCCKLS